tara:strand:- start:54 stop:2081 length:2028 start_codon:yes stop_codon:yes gene_type:complete
MAIGRVGHFFLRTMAGVSVVYVEQFLGTLCHQEPVTAGWVYENIIKPKTETDECSWIELYPDNVGKATVCVTHTWETGDFKDMLRTLIEYGSTHPDTYFYIHLLCANHHAKIRLTSFVDRVKEIGHAIFLSSIYEPPYMTDQLYLWKLFCSIDAISDVKIVIPWSQQIALDDRILKEQHDVLPSLARMDDNRLFADSFPDRAKETVEQLLQMWIRNVAITVVSNAKSDDLSIAGVALMVGSMYFETKDYNLAIHYYKLALPTYLRFTSHPNLTCVYVSLSLAYSCLAEYTETIKYLKLDMELRKKWYPPNHHTIGMTYTSLGNAYIGLQDYDSALQWYLKAPPILCKALGPSHIVVGRMYNNIGVVYTKIKRYTEAKKFYDLSLQIKRSVYGNGHPTVADTLSNLGEALRHLDEYEKSMECYNEALSINTKLHGETHIGTGICHYSLGLLYFDMKEYEKSIGKITKSLSILEMIVGRNHPMIAIGYDTLRVAYKHVGNVENTRIVCMKALEIRQHNLGETHPDVARLLVNMGNVYMSGYNDPDLATVYYLKALKIQESVYTDADDKYIAMTYNNLSTAYTAKGHNKEALSLYKKSLPMMKRGFGDDHENTALTFGGMGMAYLNIGEEEKAVEALKTAISILSKIDGREKDAIWYETRLNKIKSGREGEKEIRCVE